MVEKPSYKKLEQRFKELEEESVKHKWEEEVLQQRTHDLGERVKELNCLYGISNLVEKPDISLEEIIQGAVDIIPLSWQYPELTCARISLEGQEFKTDNFSETTWKQTSDVSVYGETVGSIAVCYLIEKPESDEGPFLKEERNLINAIAERLGHIIEHKRAEETLQKAHDELEQRVQERTVELSKTNEQLKREMTERKHAEEALQESEEKFRGLFNDALDMIHIVDEDGKIIDANPAELETMAYTRDEYIGKHVLEIVHPDYQSASKAALDSVFEGKEVKGLETAWITKHGKRIIVEVNAVPQIAIGKVVSIRAITRNINESKQAREALRKSEEQYKSLVENITLGVALIDLDHNVIMANKAHGKMLNKHPNKLIGKKCFQEFEKREKICPHCPGVQAMKTGQAAEVDTVAVRDDGTKFDVRICVFPVFGSNATVTGFIEIVEETTEKNELEAQLQMSQKMEAIGTLAGGIAHDFNNLLMGIQGNASLMFKDIDSSHSHYERLKSIEKQIQSGVKLTSQLLGYARKGQYEVIPISLNQIVNETSDTFGQAKKEIVIHKKLAEELYAIEADQGQIEQVLLNLFVNAADALPRGGDLYLETKNVTKKDLKNKSYKPTSDKYVLLIVKDTGIGMDKSTTEHIFEPFFTTKEMGRGTGLGLASVYGIIKAHGGYIDVESKEKHGTTFRVYLPATKRKVKKAAKTYDEFIKGTGTVLLVDDEEIIQDVCKEMLKTIGYRVFSAIDGKEALKLYGKNQDKIDIVLLDMTMPNMSGGEVYDCMKEINPDLKVLLSSGYSIDGEATKILERGCNGFIQKPFNMEELSVKIREILDKK